MTVHPFDRAGGDLKLLTYCDNVDAHHSRLS